VDLVPEEVAELAAVMNEAAWPDEQDYARLRRQANRA
jgi:hypothetical protein